MIYLTRKCEFSASHYYHNPQFSDEENKRVFGKCNNPCGHGHNYTLDVTVKGNVAAQTGFVMDLKDLRDLLEEEIMQVFDHRNINKEVSEFSVLIPTTENIAIAIWQRLQPKLEGVSLYRIRLFESDDLFVDYYGEA